MFADELRKAMREKGISQVELSTLTGIPKSGISQYLSGKNEPPTERKERIAAALELPEDYFLEARTEIEITPVTEPNLPVEKAAKLMGKSKEFVYQGLQAGVFPWGYAVKMGSHWSYYISAVRFKKEVCSD